MAGKPDHGDGFVHGDVRHEAIEVRMDQGRRRGTRLVTLGLLTLETVLVIGFAIAYTAGYGTADVKDLSSAIEGGRADLIKELSEKEQVTVRMKWWQVFFSLIVAVGSLGTGLQAVWHLHRAGIFMAVLAQVALWSTITTFMSMDAGLSVFATVINAIGLLTCAGLYRLSDSIKECRLGSEEVVAAEATMKGYKMLTLAASVMSVIFGIVLVGAAWSIEFPIGTMPAVVGWCAYFVGLVALVAGFLGLIGTWAMVRRRARGVLVACFSVALCAVSCGLIPVASFWYNGEGLDVDCKSMLRVAIGYTNQVCDEKKAAFNLRLAFLFLTVVSTAVLSFASFQLSETFQSRGINGLAGELWTVGHRGQIKVIRSVVQVELQLTLLLTGVLTGFAIFLRKENEDLKGYLDLNLKTSWTIITQLVLVVVLRLVASELKVTFSRRLLIFVAFLELRVVAYAYFAAFHTAGVAGFGVGFSSILQTIQIRGTRKFEYPGSRGDGVTGLALVLAILAFVKVAALALHFVELESDYDLNGTLLWPQEPAKAPEPVLLEPPLAPKPEAQAAPAAAAAAAAAAPEPNEIDRPKEQELDESPDDGPTISV